MVKSRHVEIGAKCGNGHVRTGREVKPIREWTRADYALRPAREADKGTPSVVNPRSTRTHFRELEALRRKFGAES